MLCFLINFDKFKIAKLKFVNSGWIELICIFKILMNTIHFNFTKYINDVEASVWYSYQLTKKYFRKSVKPNTLEEDFC